MDDDEGNPSHKAQEAYTFEYMQNINDPFVLAVVAEDAAACTGVLVALGGIGATYITGNVMFDAAASIVVGGLLASVAVLLVKSNQKFLLRASIEPETEQSIKNLLLARPAIEAVHSVQTQWLGPSEFVFKAEFDVDGTVLAARLYNQYEKLFLDAASSGTLEEELPVLLALHAEDVTLLMEAEVRAAESEIQTAYPAAQWVELEADSIMSRGFSAVESQSRKLEEVEMRQALSEVGAVLAQKVQSASDAKKT